MILTIFPGLFFLFLPLPFLFLRFHNILCLEKNFLSFLRFLPFPLMLIIWFTLFFFSLHRDLPLHLLPFWSSLRYILLFLVSLYLFYRLHNPSRGSLSLFLEEVNQYLYFPWVSMLMNWSFLYPAKFYPTLYSFLSRPSNPGRRKKYFFLLFSSLFFLPLLLFSLGQFWSFFWTGDLSWSWMVMPLLFLPHIHNLLLLFFQAHHQTNLPVLLEALAHLQKEGDKFTYLGDILLFSQRPSLMKNAFFVQELERWRLEYIYYFQRWSRNFLSLRLLFCSFLWLYLLALSLDPSIFSFTYPPILFHLANRLCIPLRTSPFTYPSVI